jgi:hypothetical protein
MIIGRTFQTAGVAVLDQGSACHDLDQMVLWSGKQLVSQQIMMIIAMPSGSIL